MERQLRVGDRIGVPFVTIFWSVQGCCQLEDNIGDLRTIISCC